MRKLRNYKSSGSVIDKPEILISEKDSMSKFELKRRKNNSAPLLFFTPNCMCNVHGLFWKEFISFPRVLPVFKMINKTILRVPHINANITILLFHKNGSWHIKCYFHFHAQYVWWDLYNNYTCTHYLWACELNVHIFGLLPQKFSILFFFVPQLEFS